MKLKITKINPKFWRWSRRSLVVTAAVVIAIIALGGSSYALFLGGSNGPSANSASVNLSKGLVGYWKLDGNAKDSTPYANDGTVVGTVTPANDRKGHASGALSFSGTNQYITIPSTESNFMSQGNENASWSLSIWTKGGTNTGILFGKAGYNGGIEENSNSTYDFRLFASDHSTRQIVYTGNTSQWNLLTAVYAAGEMYFYVNGQLVGSTVGPTTLYPYANWMGIASGGNNNWLTSASLSDARLYSRALNSNEVTALYNQYDPGVKAAAGENGLVGWWKLNGNAKDATPYANNGTVAGGVTPTTDRKGAANGAYSFSSGSINVPNSPQLTFGVGSNFSVSAWIKPTSPMGTWEGFIGKGGQDNRLAGYELFTGSNNSVNLRLTWPGGPQYGISVGKSGLTLDDGNWHFISGVVNRSTNTAYLYVDNLPVSSINISSAGDTTSAANLTLGTSGAGSYEGALSDVRIYDRALSATEVSNLYNSYDSQVELGGSGATGTVSLGKGLVGEWDMNGNAKDATPYSDNGTVTGATLTTNQKGRANSAYYFNGSSYITASDSTALRLNGSFAISLWYKDNGTTTSYPGLISKGPGSSSGNGWNLFFAPSGGQIIFKRDNSQQVSNPGLITTAWNYVTVTYDGTNLKYYTNGVLRNTFAANYVTNINSSVLQMGLGDSGQYILGSLDDVRIYNRALSGAEVQALYNETD